KSVATWEEIWATGFDTEPDDPNPKLRAIPELEHRMCVGGLDYARIKDFASVGLLFKVDGNYVWKTHSFVRGGFLKQVKLNARVEKRDKQGVNTIVADTFRLDLVKTALEAEGFELVYIRKPKAIHSLLAPRIETAFAKNQLIFGDNPLMRWATNNVLVVTKKDGNKEYHTKDELTRKTDPFQAFIHAMYKADDLLIDEDDFILHGIHF